VNKFISIEKDMLLKNSVADTERLTRTFPFRVQTSDYNFEQININEKSYLKIVNVFQQKISYMT
jgi:hypothetical protein